MNARVRGFGQARGSSNTRNHRSLLTVARVGLFPRLAVRQWAVVNLGDRHYRGNVLCEGVEGGDLFLGGARVPRKTGSLEIFGQGRAIAGNLEGRRGVQSRGARQARRDLKEYVHSGTRESAYNEEATEGGF